MLDARWSICTPTGSPGAIAVFQIEGDVDGALAAIGAPAMRPGEVGLRSLLGIDSGVAARWDHGTLHLMPHAGAEVQRELARALTAAGIAPHAPDHRPGYPEAPDQIEHLMLRALARAASPLAIDLLLDQPRRWRHGSDGCAASRILNRLIDPPLVVAIGPSNIGKSSLVNALAGRAVSIVADEPGTTRDHVGVTLDLAGLVVRYADTPGLRTGADRIERKAAAIAHELAAHADLVLLCGDRSAPPPEFAGSALTLRLALRADLGFAGWTSDAGVSSLTGAGLPALVSGIRERLVPDRALQDPRPWEFWTAPGT